MSRPSIIRPPRLSRSRRRHPLRPSVPGPICRGEAADTAKIGIVEGVYRRIRGTGGERTAGFQMAVDAEQAGGVHGPQVELVRKIARTTPASPHRSVIKLIKPGQGRRPRGYGQ